MSSASTHWLKNQPIEFFLIGRFVHLINLLNLLNNKFVKFIKHISKKW